MARLRRTRILSGAALAATLAIFLTAFPVFSGQRPESVDKFAYHPVNLDFWKSVGKLIDRQKQDDIFKIKKPGEDTAPETVEWRLALARALLADGNYMHAQYLLIDVAMKGVGTRQGLEALRMLSDLAKANAIDDIAMENLAFELDTTIDEPEAKSMIAYFRGRALLRRGYPDWARQSVADIRSGTTWAAEFDYDRTLQQLNAGDSTGAYQGFEALTKNDKARIVTVHQSQLALARLIFERKDYAAAIKIYHGVDLPMRERARVLNEIAWSYYYDRAYGKSLGAIEALRSKYFADLFSPESSVLEMLIYRELCQYKRVKELAARFQFTFDGVYSAIADRKPVENVPRFEQIMLQEGVMQKRAEVIQQIRVERALIAKQTWSDDELHDWMIAQDEKHEKMAEADIHRMMRDRKDQTANWFLGIRDQVSFLDYEASLKLVQLQTDEAVDFEPPKKSNIRMESIFWPVTGEAWLDELPSYEVIVHSQCRSLPGATPGSGTK